MERLIIFSHRGGAHDVRRPLVVRGWSQAGVPQHQQLCHASDGDPSLSGRSLPFQHPLSLPEGVKWLEGASAGASVEPREARWAQITSIHSLFDTQDLHEGQVGGF